MPLENNSNLQKVEGYVSKITKNGNKVTNDSLSSGGVRHQNGTLEELIKEPRLVENPSKLNSFATSVIGDVTNQLTQKVANHLVNEVIPRSINNWKERRAEKRRTEATHIATSSAPKPEQELQQPIALNERNLQDMIDMRTTPRREIMNDELLQEKYVTALIGTVMI
ncbi:hypothetical protein [Corynebacterium glutamicum]|uniref:Uncharacterized protein n=1 Tax=Corynebacterium glutamicum TaxID=1718 RepID=A0AB36I743_CORGT|nr:hypothetical protein [Corynebacterium glutamicum]AGN18542.1 hypothetical protein C624_04775 [Corynebacterium glutamicum SCgG1]AGN21565.1 hypothetical protein C629_04775 [Corynebacterium glutamicum SCgG2]ALZ99569.1 hypothetical protein APT58_04610 [Corynebacterium glutamicum]EGV39390.1 hypothetical protein CgS9114_13026 [Corynebacterium glutamicum S9114]EOA66180.1 hypothetical protein J433_00510 [Corynebacterium glutamicum MT]